MTQELVRYARAALAKKKARTCAEALGAVLTERPGLAGRAKGWAGAGKLGDLTIEELRTDPDLYREYRMASYSDPDRRE